MLKKNVALIGLSGCGKSSVGERLAFMLNAPFYDSDTEIELIQKMKITDIFSNGGESVFREIESGVIKSLSRKKNCVISTGGGCVKNPENIHCLKESGVIVYMQSTPEKIYECIRTDKSRPLLQGGENLPDEEQEAFKLQRLTALLNERAPLYEKYADITVDVSGLDINQAAGKIKDMLF